MIRLCSTYSTATETPRPLLRFLGEVFHDLPRLECQAESSDSHSLQWLEVSMASTACYCVSLFRLHRFGSWVQFQDSENHLPAELGEVGPQALGVALP